MRDRTALSRSPGTNMLARTMGSKYRSTSCGSGKSSGRSAGPRPFMWRQCTAWSCWTGRPGTHRQSPLQISTRCDRVPWGQSTPPACQTRPKAAGETRPCEAAPGIRTGSRILQGRLNCCEFCRRGWNHARWFNGPSELEFSLMSVTLASVRDSFSTEVRSDSKSPVSTGKILANTIGCTLL